MLSRSWYDSHSNLPLGVFCQWVLHSSFVPKPKTIIASLTRWDQKSKDVAHPLKSSEKFMIPNLSHHFYQRTQAIPGSDLGLIEFIFSGSDWIYYSYEERFMTNGLLQYLAEFLVEFDEFHTGSWFPIVHISRYCAGCNREKSTGIHGGADPRFHLCQEDTATRGCGSSAL